MVDQFDEPGQFLSISVVKQISINAVSDQLPVSTGSRCHNRNAERHRFKEGLRKPFDDRWQDKGIKQAVVGQRRFGGHGARANALVVIVELRQKVWA